MRDFLLQLGLKYERSGQPGRMLNGPQVDKVWKNLDLLHEMLNERGDKVIGDGSIDYLKKLRALYLMCARYFLFCSLLFLQHFYSYSSKTLPRDYAQTIQEFRDSFDNMYAFGFLAETPKIHILYSHLEDYLDIQAKNNRWTLALADCQGLEACHSGLRKSDKRHNCEVKHAQVVLSPILPPFNIFTSLLYYLFLSLPSIVDTYLFMRRRSEDSQIR